jgi:hypothetical protein
LPGVVTRMEAGQNPKKKKKRGVVWAQEAPLLGNRLMWREVFSVLSTVWLLMAPLVSLGFWMAWREDPDGAKGNLLIGLGWMTVVIWGGFLVVIFFYFLFKGRQMFRFTLDPYQATSVGLVGKSTRMMAGLVGVMASLAGQTGLAVAAAAGASQKRTMRRVPWKKLRKVRLHPDLLAVSLYRRPWPFLPLVLYLPHEEGYEQVVQRIAELRPDLDLG